MLSLLTALFLTAKGNANLTSEKQITVVPHLSEKK
jgi:hypothetical protein